MIFAANCVDVATNCAQLASLCNNSLYLQLLTQNCARTCSRCWTSPSVNDLFATGNKLFFLLCTYASELIEKFQFELHEEVFDRKQKANLIFAVPALATIPFFTTFYNLSLTWSRTEEGQMNWPTIANFAPQKYSRGPPHFVRASLLPIADSLYNFI